MRLPIASVLLCLLVSAAARAALPNGTQAPDFQAEASIGGKTFKFSLAEALKKGPVVLYFYPAAFTPGCTAEAHDFAQATEEYKALGATVIGVSHDTIDTLNRFSVSECRSKFAVAADTDQAIMKAYDAVLAGNPGYANRTSYMIASDGRIVYSYTNLDPGKHVGNTLAALREWLASQKKPSASAPCSRRSSPTWDSGTPIVEGRNGCRPPSLAGLASGWSARAEDSTPEADRRAVLLLEAYR